MRMMLDSVHIMTRIYVMDDVMDEGDGSIDVNSDRFVSLVMIL